MEGPNNFLFLKGGGGVGERGLLKGRYLRGGLYRGFTVRPFKHTRIHHPATYWGGLIPASSSANFTFDFPPFNFACATVSCSNY